VGQLAPAGTIAAGRECAVFGAWIDELPAAGHEALIQLRECGFACDLELLEAQLRRALHAGPVGPLSRLVGQRLLALLATRGPASCLLIEGQD
jgi:hypothetical protein